MVAVRRVLVGQEKKVTAAYRSGLSLEAIAARFDVSVETVRRALDRAGERRRPSGRPRVNLTGSESEIVAAYQGGSSLEDLALAFACSVKPIRDLLTREGVSFRPPGRRRRVAGAEREIAAAYVNGASLETLAQRYGVTRKQIARACEEHGVALRPPGRPRRVT